MTKPSEISRTIHGRLGLAAAAGVLALLAGAAMPATAGEIPSISDCRDEYYSTSSTHYADQTLLAQGVYALPGSVKASGDLFLGLFVPTSNQIDAIDVIDSSSMRFSTARSGYVYSANGIVFVQHDESLLATRTAAGIEVVPDPDWAVVGLNLRSLDALHFDGTCFAFSVAALEPHPDGGYMRPWEVYRGCPGASPVLLFDAIAGLNGVRDIDAVHIDGTIVEFSTGRDLYLPGRVRVWNENTYRCEPSGTPPTCGPADLVRGLDGVALRLRDLDAFSDGDGVACDDGDDCTTGDACEERECSGAPMVCEQDDDECTLDVCDGGECQPTVVDGECDECLAHEDCASGDQCLVGQCNNGVCMTVNVCG